MLFEKNTKQNNKIKYYKYKLKCINIHRFFIDFDLTKYNCVYFA